MNLLRPVADHKQKLVEQKIERAAAQVAFRVLADHLRVRDHIITEVGRRPLQMAWGSFQSKVGELAIEKLTASGVEDWTFNAAASKEASQTNKGYGYCNSHPVWKEDMTIVFSHIEPCADVQQLDHRLTVAHETTQQLAA